MTSMRVDLRHAQKSPRAKAVPGVGPDDGLDGGEWWPLRSEVITKRSSEEMPFGLGPGRTPNILYHWQKRWGGEAGHSGGAKSITITQRQNGSEEGNSMDDWWRRFFWELGHTIQTTANTTGGLGMSSGMRQNL